jgi:hypothetical protein
MLVSSKYHPRSAAFAQQEVAQLPREIRYEMNERNFDELKYVFGTLRPVRQE